MNFKEDYPKILLFLFSIFWIIVAIKPHYRSVWVAENILSVILIFFLIVTYKKFRFSNFTYSMLFLFMILHTIGSYYSYAGVPLFFWIQETFNLSRNHYDRVVHFLFGLVFFFPVLEILERKLKIKNSWAFLLAFLVIVSMKGIFEIIEWGYVWVTSENISVVENYLGMQGDVWDAQKDISVGMVGAFLSWIGIFLKRKFK